MPFLPVINAHRTGSLHRKNVQRYKNFFDLLIVINSPGKEGLNPQKKVSKKIFFNLFVFMSTLNNPQLCMARRVEFSENQCQRPTSFVFLKYILNR